MQQVAIVMQSTIIIAALKIVTVAMLSVCHPYVHRDANTFSLNDIFHVRFANYVLCSVLHGVQNVSFYYIISVGGMSVEIFL
jgi:hypothetical protein